MHDLRSFNRMDSDLVNTHPSEALKFINATTTQDAGSSLGNVNFVEWYWVTLGLVVPVLCGAAFCLLDYFRQRRKKRFRSAARIESMCERNKYSPPLYDEVVPGQIIIEPIIPPYRAAVNHVDETQPTAQSPKTATITNQTSANPSQPSEKKANSIPSKPTTTEPDGQVAGPSSAAQTNPLASATRVIQADAVSVISEDIPEEAPPSYDDHHLYDIYGSRAHLV